MATEQVNDGKATEEELREREVDGLGRELVAAQHRLEELKAMNAHPDELAAAEQRIANATDQLEALGGRKGASKRPRSGAKTR